jgi:hypothetical protein
VLLIGESEKNHSIINAHVQIQHRVSFSNWVNTWIEMKTMHKTKKEGEIKSIGCL